MDTISILCLLRICWKCNDPVGSVFYTLIDHHIRFPYECFIRMKQVLKFKDKKSTFYVPVRKFTM